MTARRFPPLWTVEEVEDIGAAFVVKDSNGQMAGDEQPAML